MKKNIIIMALSIALCSCSSLQDIGVMETGVRVSQQQETQIKTGISQEDVLKVLGYPTSKREIANKIIWEYEYQKIVSFGSNINEKKIVEFDVNRKVIGIYNARGNSSNNNPLLNAAR